MQRQSTKLAELVPLIDRYLWLIGCRSLLTAFLVAFLALGDAGQRSRLTLTALAGGWLLLSCAVVPVVRRSRGTAVIAFAVSLLGDGALLSSGWWVLGGPGGALEIVIGVHVLSTTLLVSFRTGIKLALWYTVLAYSIVETAAAGYLRLAGPIPVVPMISYLTSLWLITVVTAGCAAINERELRRRRFDSEVLRLLALDLNQNQDPVQIIRRLVSFARDDMLVERVAMMVYPVEGDRPVATGVGLAADHRGQTVLTDLVPADMDDCVRTAGSRPAVQLYSSLDPQLNPRLHGLFTDAGRVVVMPFEVEQAVGVVAVQLDDPGRLRSVRVERRLIAALHQATLQAGMALSRELLSSRLRAMAETDALTGLANRGAFNRRLAGAVSEATGSGEVFALVIVDLDHFKQVNDTYGHQAGDVVLKAAAQVLQTSIRAQDLAARYGGEEFALILPGLDSGNAFVFAERLRQAIAAAPTEVPITASMGVSVFPTDAADGEGMLAEADAALYRAKGSGRNRVGTTAHRDVAAAPQG